MFEDFAVERLRVLRTLEKHNMGGKTKFSEDWVSDIWRDLEKNGLVHYLQLGERQHGTEKVRGDIYITLSTPVLLCSTLQQTYSSPDHYLYR